jgi:hypothetical protein
MAVGLVVREPFGEYANGALIDDAEKVAVILASDRAGSVIKIAVPDTVAPPPPPPAATPVPLQEPAPPAHEPAPTAPESHDANSEKGA